MFFVIFSSHFLYCLDLLHSGDYKILQWSTMATNAVILNLPLVYSNLYSFWKDIFSFKMNCPIGRDSIILADAREYKRHDEPIDLIFNWLVLFHFLPLSVQEWKVKLQTHIHKTKQHNIVPLQSRQEIIVSMFVLLLLRLGWLFWGFFYTFLSNLSLT